MRKVMKSKAKPSKPKAMNKDEFTSFIAKHFSHSKVDAQKAVNLFIKSVVQAFKEGKGINLVGFGSFSIQRREARVGVNPKTGKKMDINAYNQPVFRGGKSLKVACKDVV